MALPALKGADGGKEGLVGGVAEVAAGEILRRIVGQAVDELADLEIGPDGVHGVGGVVAHRVQPDILGQLRGDLVGDVGVARKGIVEPPQHRHGGAAEGPHRPGHDHGVDEDEVGAEGQPPEVRGGADARPGDDGGPGVHEELQRPAIAGAQHHHFVAHAAQHRHGADQHDGS